MQKIQTFGETIRKLREDNGMPLRKLAALLDIDQSTLSKIERNERKANAAIINKLTKIFKINKKDLQINFLSDKVAYELLDEEFGAEALQVAEEKIKYLRKINGNS
jgi:transcriptional regulator with XRE-family HTH domain